MSTPGSTDAPKTTLASTDVVTTDSPMVVTGIGKLTYYVWDFLQLQWLSTYVWGL